ncbi:YeiH family protein [Streptacidiphilus cavernicola]|uniref:YeiH family protein n=1 Tax=Streptacidiphilus cavernicola TaxID=3342716 RepID=A0ABV6VZB5_9ACTN
MRLPLLRFPAAARAGTGFASTFASRFASGFASARAKGREAGPGTLAAGLAVAAGAAVHHWLGSVSVLTAAVALGVLAGNLGLLPARTRPGLALIAKRVMRLAVVLLGLKLAVGDVLGLGWRALLLVVVVVGVTFWGTRWLGRLAGLPGDQPLLIATGFSICGASAVAAMNGVTESDEQDAVTAVALVTLCGSLAIAVLPLLRHPLGLDPEQFGRWTGASVHDIAQVVAVAQTAGPLALSQAVVIKLMRIALLAPIVTGVAVARRSRVAREGGEGGEGRRPPLVPLFVLGFLGCVALRSGSVLPASVLNLCATVDELLMAAALFALGSAVDVRSLLRTGRRALLVGLGSWLLIAGLSYLGVLATT